MSRNGTGTYTTPNTFVAGEVITASDHNENWADAADELTNSVAVDGQSTMTGPLKAASGTAAAPGVTFGSDLDTGLYRKAANTLGVAAAGAEVLEVSADGLEVTGDLEVSGDLSVDGVVGLLMPIGTIMPYAGSTEPTGFVFCDGTSYLRTAKAALFAVIGTTYGAADGTHFNVPDLQGRVPAMKDLTGTRLTSATMSPNGSSLNATGGTQTHTLTLAQAPTGITSANASQSISVTSSDNVTKNASYISYVDDAGGGTTVLNAVPTNTPLTSTGSNSISVTSNNTSGSAHLNVQPTLLVNYIICAGA
jgi:microcystin-dependent protein